MKIITDILLYLWQFPQNIIGLIHTVGLKKVHNVNGVNVYLTDCFDGSMSLGNYIFISYEPDGILLRHEYGHHIQSLRQGWLYMLITFLPSYMWCRFFFKGSSLNEYYKFFTERTANALVKKR